MKGVRRFEALADRVLRLLEYPLVGLSIILVCIGAILFRNLGADPDLFARVAMGRLIATTGQVPTVDPFSFAPKLPSWIDHEWLAGFIFYTVSQSGGDHALYMFKFLAMALSVLFLHLALVEYNPDAAGSKRFVWLCFTTVCSVTVWMSTVRAQVFTYLFLAIYFYLMARIGRRNTRLLSSLPPVIMLLWANSHGGFVTGLGLFGIFVAVQYFRTRDRSLLVSFGCCVLATLVNPYGIHFWGYILSAVSMPRQDIPEWHSVSLLDKAALLPGFCSLVLVCGALLRCKKLDVFALICLSVAAYFGFRHYRLQAIYFFAAAVFGFQYFDACCEWIRSRRAELWRMLTRSGSAAVSLCFAFALLVVIKGVIGWRGLDYSYYPVAALDWLHATERGGKLLVDFNRGSFALWRMYPKFQISVDGRYEEVYPDSTLYLVDDALNPDSQNQRNALAELKPDYILLDAASEAASKPEAFSPLNVISYRDEKFVVLGKHVSGSASVLDSETAGVKQIWKPKF